MPQRCSTTFFSVCASAQTTRYTATDLGELVAANINNSGQVVGYCDCNPTRAFITGRDGVGKTELGTLAGGFTVATGVNNVGQVAGHSWISGNPATDAIVYYHAFITGRDGVGMTDLGTLSGGPSVSVTGINNRGQVVGGGTTTFNTNAPPTLSPPALTGWA